MSTNTWIVPLPDGVHIDEPVRLCIEADLQPDGTFGREWLVVTEGHVFVFAQDGTEQNGVKASLRHELPLKELTEPKAEALVGGGVLEVMRNGARLELVRYTNARAPRFNTAAQLLDKWIKSETATIPEEEGRRCAKFGMFY